MNFSSPNVVCTALTKSYRAFALQLAESLSAYGVELVALYIDEIEGHFDPESEPYHVLQLGQLGDEARLERMAFRYDAFEFCCAIRPWLHQYLVDHTSLDKWLFLDTDIWIKSDPAPLFEEIDDCSILLSPHSVGPSSSPLALESVQLQFGTFNAGMIGIHRSEAALKFIGWWRDSLVEGCFREPSLFVDQLWLNLVPTHFSDVKISYHPGANVSFWNLWERQVSSDPEGRILINGEPLIFVHFARSSVPNRTFFQDQVDSDPVPSEFSVLFEEYSRAVENHGLSSCSAWPYSYGAFSNGETILKGHRKTLEEWEQVGSQLGTPFLAHGEIDAIHRRRISRWRRYARKLSRMLGSKGR